MGGGGGGQMQSGTIADKALGYNAKVATLQQGMNTMNQSNAMGSSTYSQDGTTDVTLSDGSKISIPKYSQKTTLSPEMQAIFNSSTGGANSALSRFNSQGAFNGDQAMEDKISSLESARLDPYWANQSDQFDAKMAGQGIVPGSEAYDDAYRTFSQGKNDDYNSMWLSAHDDAYNQAKDEYNMPLQTAGSMLQLAQGTNPTFGAVPQTGVSGVDFGGLANAQNQSNQAKSSGTLGGLFGLGGSILSLL